MKKPLTLAAALLALLAIQQPASAGTSSKLRPINEAGDTRPCATYDETMAIFAGMPRLRVQRILDTPGHRGGGRILGGLAAGYGARHEHRNTFVSYPICEEIMQPGDVMVVEFNDRPRQKVVSAYYGPRN